MYENGKKFNIKKILLISIIFLVLAKWCTLFSEDIRDYGKYKRLINKALTYENNGEFEKAEKYYKKAAKHDNEAYYEIALMYYYNINREIGLKKLKEVYEKYEISDAAKILGYTAYKKNDTEEAKKWYTISAKDGDTDSKYYLGELFEREGNLVEAKKWYLQGAQSDDTASMHKLVYIYFLKGNIEKMSEWRKCILERKGAENITYSMKKEMEFMFGSEKQQKYFNLLIDAAKYIEQSKYKDAENKYIEAAKMYEDGNIRLGLFYYYEVGDKEKGKTVLNNAYKNKIKGAALYLGDIASIEKKHEEGKKWYEKGAEEGDYRAQYNLAMWYYNNKDLENAEKFYLMAANQNEGMAMYDLMWLYYEKKDMRNAVKWAKNILDGEAVENLTSNMKEEAFKIQNEIE